MKNVKRTKKMNLIRQTARDVIGYLLLVTIVLIGLPQNYFGQDTKRSAKPFVLSKQTNSTSNKMSARSLSEVMSNAKRDNAGIVTTKASGGDGTSYAVLNVEFRTTASRQAVFTDQKISQIGDAYVLTVIDKFADVFVRTDAAWDAIKNNENVLKVEYSAFVKAPPPPDVEAAKLVSQAIPEKIVRGGYDGLTGKNVIIAVLDTGIDFHHPDFITYDSQQRPTSRISYLWDTATPYQTGRGGTAPFKFPNGTSIGTLYSKQQLTEELRTGAGNIPVTDLDGHGTACTSVAAGNGNADKQAGGLNREAVVGVAPDADIIGVRLGEEGLENSYLLNAIVEWLERVAGKTPLVVSGSFGGHYAGHDGQRVEERQLNARFPQNKAGRAIVFAAGNEGNDPIHSKVNFAAEAKVVVWNAKRETRINVYFDSDDSNIQLYGTKSTSLDNMKVEKNPITNQYEVKLGVSPGVGAVWFENVAGRQSEAHLYFSDSRLGSFAPEYVSFSNLVGTPGTTENAITVGSYDWNDNFHNGGSITNLSAVCRDSTGARMPFEIGWLSCYSSPGPNRDGKVKPDIAAPGEWFTSANARVDGETASWGQPDTTGMYRAMNGTSAATPYTSGVIALMFQKNPALTGGEVKTLLKRHSSKSGLSPFNQGIPNNNWGYGKLDMAAVDRIFAALDAAG